MLETNTIELKGIEISVSHFLPNHPTCGLVHGHNLLIDVKIHGLGRVKKMLVDFTLIKAYVRKFDHHSLNQHLKYPTSENFASLLAFRILRLADQQYPYITGVTVRVQETEKCSFEKSIMRGEVQVVGESSETF